MTVERFSSFLANDKIQKLKCVISYFNVKFDRKRVEKMTYKFLVQSKEREHRKSGHLGLDPVHFHCLSI